MRSCHIRLSLSYCPMKSCTKIVLTACLNSYRIIVYYLVKRIENVVWFIVNGSFACKIMLKIDVSPVSSYYDSAAIRAISYFIACFTIGKEIKWVKRNFFFHEVLTLR